MTKPVGPYTPIVRSGDLLFVSGQVGLGPDGLVPGGLEAELRQVFVNLNVLLESMGARLDDVVKTTVFMVDIGDYDEMNRVYVEGFVDHRPARSAVAVAALPIGATIELEAIAHLGTT